MNTSAHYQKLENMYNLAPINRFFKPKLELGEGIAKIEMAVVPDFFHTAGSAHGAVYFKALDDAAFFAVGTLVTDVFVVTVNFNLYLVRPISSGTIQANGRVVHRTKRLFIAEAEAYSDTGKLIARGSGSFMRSQVALNDINGYR